MNIDPDAAGLLAQVIPSLLVFLALEDRLSPANVPRRKVRRRLSKWREVAVIMNLAALFLCLIIVVTGLESAGVSWFIGVSVGYLVAVLALLFAAMFGKEEGRGLKRLQ
ncbi:hypothetical protein ABFP37_01255 [Burkholderia sp. RS01]|uniref:hypothetical protein n=1 Tax=unclassified Burkholderia TaxID=2613784 RepID=UPI0032189E72